MKLISTILTRTKIKIIRIFQYLIRGHINSLSVPLLQTLKSQCHINFSFAFSYFIGVSLNQALSSFFSQIDHSNLIIVILKKKLMLYLIVTKSARAVFTSSAQPPTGRGKKYIILSFFNVNFQIFIIFFKIKAKQISQRLRFLLYLWSYIWVKPFYKVQTNLMSTP